MKCKGTELIPRHHQITFRLLLIWLKFRQLGTPMSNHFPFRCALSTSALVGAARSCMQRLEAPSNNELRILMTTWKIVLIRLIWPQSPSCNIITASECLCWMLMTTANMRLVRNTDKDINEAVMSMILRRLCHVLHVRAIGCFGFI